MVKLLFTGADIEAKDSSYWTLLSRAAHYGHEAVVQQLQEKGANVEATRSYSERR